MSVPNSRIAKASEPAARPLPPAPDPILTLTADKELFWLLRAARELRRELREILGELDQVRELTEEISEARSHAWDLLSSMADIQVFRGE